jgi:hypothetical protein
LLFNGAKIHKISFGARAFVIFFKIFFAI